MSISLEFLTKQNATDVDVPLNLANLKVPLMNQKDKLKNHIYEKIVIPKIQAENLEIIDSMTQLKNDLKEANTTLDEYTERIRYGILSNLLKVANNTEEEEDDAKCVSKVTQVSSANDEHEKSNNSACLKIIYITRMKFEKVLKAAEAKMDGTSYVMNKNYYKYFTKEMRKIHKLCEKMNVICEKYKAEKVDIGDVSVALLLLEKLKMILSVINLKEEKFAIIEKLNHEGTPVDSEVLNREIETLSTLLSSFKNNISLFYQLDVESEATISTTENLQIPIKQPTLNSPSALVPTPVLEKRKFTEVKHKLGKRFESPLSVPIPKEDIVVPITTSSLTTFSKTVDGVSNLSVDQINSSAQAEKKIFVTHPQHLILPCISNTNSSAFTIPVSEIKVPTSTTQSQVAIFSNNEILITEVGKHEMTPDLVENQELSMHVEEMGKADGDTTETDYPTEKICNELFENYLRLSEENEKNKMAYQLLTDNAYKTFRFSCKKAINTPVNAISGLDAPHMLDKYNKIVSSLDTILVTEARYKYPAVVDQVIPYAFDLLASKLISHAEYAISSKPEAAFPIASIIVALWVKYHKFGNLFLAHIMDKCPYIIPMYFPQLEGQSDEDYYKTLGYRYNEDNKIEEQNMFLKRMKGIIRLYAAVIVSPTRNNEPHPYGLQHAWTWLAAILNLEPHPDITATLIYEFLEVTGYYLKKNYGQQFDKLIWLLAEEFLPKIRQITLDGCHGPVIRLKLYLERVSKEGFNRPLGVLHAKFW